MLNYRINIIFSKDRDGYYVFCPELPGCQSQGDTYEEAKENIKEAIDLYLETMTKEEMDEALNKELITTTMEVSVG